MSTKTDTPASDMILAKANAAEEMIIAQSSLSPSDIEQAQRMSQYQISQATQGLGVINSICGRKETGRWAAVTELSLRMTAAKIRAAMDVTEETAARAEGEVGRG